jgi:hypothetical protein
LLLHHGKKTVGWRQLGQKNVCWQEMSSLVMEYPVFHGRPILGLWPVNVENTSLIALQHLVGVSSRYRQGLLLG